MKPDPDVVRAFARLADALDADIRSAPEAEIAEAFRGREARVVADALRQRLRRIGAAHPTSEPPAAAPARGGATRPGDRAEEKP